MTMTVVRAEEILNHYLSYKQERLTHSREVARYGRSVAEEINRVGLSSTNPKLVFILGLLHDIGHGIMEGNVNEHAVIGWWLLKRKGCDRIGLSTATDFSTHEGFEYDLRMKIKMILKPDKDSGILLPKGSPDDLTEIMGSLNIPGTKIPIKDNLKICVNKGIFLPKTLEEKNINIC